MGCTEEKHESLTHMGFIVGIKNNQNDLVGCGGRGGCIVLGTRCTSVRPRRSQWIKYWIQTGWVCKHPRAYIAGVTRCGPASHGLQAGIGVGNDALCRKPLAHTARNHE